MKKKNEQNCHQDVTVKIIKGNKTNKLHYMYGKVQFL